jgi:archaellin
MNKAIKGISAGIIIIAFVFGAVIAWKVIDNIRQSFRQDLQESFKESLNEYGKR